MFISRKRVKSIEDRLDNRAHQSDFEFWRREVAELKIKLAAMEQALGLCYESLPPKSRYVKKGGPEREAQ